MLDSASGALKQAVKETSFVRSWLGLCMFSVRFGHGRCLSAQQMTSTSSFFSPLKDELASC